MAAERPYPFFGLALELRNKIYGELTCTILHYTTHSQSFEYDAFLIPRLRLVSHQFKLEYEKEIFRHAKLIVLARPSNKTLYLVNSEVDGKVAAAFLHKFETAVLSIDATVNQSFHLGASLAYDTPKLIEGLVTAVPKLRHLQVQLKLRSVTLDRADWGPINWGPLTWEVAHHFLDMTLSARDDMQVEKTLLLTGELYAMKRDHQGDAGHEKYVDSMNESTENHVIYKATRVSDPEQGFYGLELATYASGTFDYNSLLAEARAKSGWEGERHEDFGEDGADQGREGGSEIGW